MFCRTQSDCFGVANPRQWPLGSAKPNRVFWGYKSTTNDPQVPSNTIRVFWGYKSPTNGPLGSAKPIGVFWG
ncbi:Hypothetical protein FKW44_019251 [Caligus rogercresseyi]|uniref:Uncharacterized protein n=1 Tax=Caligus rogercresseyi TaxID=217165 RepID=A0A7T8GVM3_CALRO|nr:Hypothetical protein FKW44_019251 [Caligus rogercresseyi]